MRNDSHSKVHWLQICLRGIKTNRDGVGARVKVTVDNLILHDEVHSGRGYESHYGTSLYFGLRTPKNIDHVQIQWIGGAVDVLKDITVDQLLTIAEESNPD